MYVCMYVCMYVRTYVCMVEDRAGTGLMIYNISICSVCVYAHFVLNVLFCDNLGSIYWESRFYFMQTYTQIHSNVV